MCLPGESKLLLPVWPRGQQRQWQGWSLLSPAVVQHRQSLPPQLCSQETSHVHTHWWEFPGLCPESHCILLLCPWLARVSQSAQPLWGSFLLFREHRALLGWPIVTMGTEKKWALAEVWSPVSSVCVLEQQPVKTGLPGMLASALQGCSVGMGVLGRTVHTIIGCVHIHEVPFVNGAACSQNDGETSFIMTIKRRRIFSEGVVHSVVFCKDPTKLISTS